MHAAEGVHEHAATLCITALAPGAHLLEVGAGSGALAARLEDSGFSVTATDLEPSAPGILRLDLNDAADADFVPGSFDMLVCVETIEHIENPRAALRGMRALVVEGQRLLISTPNVMHPHSQLRALKRGSPMLFGPEAYYDTGHITPLPDWLLIEHLRSAGFEAESVTYAGEFGFASRLRRTVHKFEMLALRAVGLSQREAIGDGACLFIVARAV